MAVIVPEIRESDGRVLYPDFHDGGLEGILLFPKPYIRLFLHTEPGKKYALILNKAECLRAEDFWQGNDIFDLAFQTGNICKIDYLMELYDVKPNTPNSAFIENNLYPRVLAHELTYVEMLSSYGCQLRALCAGVQLMESDYGAGKYGDEVVQ